MAFQMLVAYATWKGSTKEVAEKIGETLQDESMQVEICAAREVKSVDSYHVVILGTGIHAGRCHPDAFRFARRHRDRRHRDKLKYIPFALFVICLTAKESTPEANAKFGLIYLHWKKHLRQLSPLMLAYLGDGEF